MGMWMYVISFLLYNKNVLIFFSGIMAELATGQALFGRYSLFFLSSNISEIYFKRVKVILINYIVFKNV
jgi:hypothetical protein